MNKLNFKYTILIGFTLFSMFFGAGNLIFPPLLGAQSGSHFIYSMIGFLITAVFVPTITIIVVAKHQGLKNLTDRIHPIFTVLFVTLVYLLIGPCVAIPRTASTSFEMALSPFLSSEHLIWARIFYSLCFFVLTSYVALHPNKLKNLLGKIMTPLLLILIGAVFIGTLINLPINIGETAQRYQEIPVWSGIVDGYQTMDILAALNFGIIISINIQDLGVKDPKQIAKEIMKAGVVAGILLGSVYCLTGYIGMHTSGYFENVTNGAQVLVYAIQNSFGSFAQILVGAIFFIACFNVCSGLLSCCAQYFHELYSKISYKTWLFGFAAFSFVVSSFGLDFILNASTPILSIMCPLAVVLIVFGIVIKPKS
ncbi:branched-chain amino acid transport system II carrier protein [uncultured Faecalicoccus sp.]|uniref:branched-chain amino acid transport system II carrier protein n=1 Tax=uncultured Faecalicoccus sp. TaxID=1971760 RepID=UPI00260A9B29|nr:branched-chain amino acid transport system II carrier protein [uncultured Faecalicoccus sp.]